MRRLGLVVALVAAPALVGTGPAARAEHAVPRLTGTTTGYVVFSHPDNPTTAHVSGSATFDGLGWVWGNADLAPAPDCTLSFNGHGLLPVELDITATCGTESFTFPTPNAIGLLPLFDAAADQVHVATGDDFQHCRFDDTSHPHQGSGVWTDTHTGPCLRAVIINGTITTVP